MYDIRNFQTFFRLKGNMIVQFNSRNFQISTSVFPTTTKFKFRIKVDTVEVFLFIEMEMLVSKLM